MLQSKFERTKLEGSHYLKIASLIAVTQFICKTLQVKPLSTS